MLVLSRLVDQEIVIGDDIIVKILGVIGTKVSIGISAPRTMPIHRREVFNQIQGLVGPERSSDQTPYSGPFNPNPLPSPLTDSKEP